MTQTQGKISLINIKTLYNNNLNILYFGYFDISLKSEYCAQNECSSWRKAADLIAQGTQAAQQIQAAATANSSQLESLPLSSLATNKSNPPQVNYGTDQPLTVSTPRAITTLVGEIQTTDTYRQIIPGMSECLYPT